MDSEWSTTAGGKLLTHQNCTGTPRGNRSFTTLVEFYAVSGYILKSLASLAIVSPLPKSPNPVVDAWLPGGHCIVYSSTAITICSASQRPAPACLAPHRTEARHAWTPGPVHRYLYLSVRNVGSGRQRACARRRARQRSSLPRKSRKMASRALGRAVQGPPRWSCLALRTIEVTEAGRAGQAERALELFEAMPVKNQVSWNAALAALVDAGRADWALSFFRKMPRRNATSYTTMIGGLSRAGRAAAAEARLLFEELPLDQHNVFTWTAMVSCHVRNGEPGKAVELFVALYADFFARGMLPNGHTFSSLLKACVGVQSLAMLLQLHGLIFKLLDEGSRHCFVWNALTDAHTKLGALSDAENVFYRMRHRDICSWNIMMDGYSRHKLVDRALDLFRSMRKKDASTWNIIICCLGANSLGEDALRLFIDLVRSECHCGGNAKLLNPSIYTTVLHTCSVLALLAFGRQVHARTVKDGFSQSSVFVSNSLISMYSSCGATLDLEQVFNEMTVRDVVSWNSVIQGLGQNGLGRQALAVGEHALELRMYNGNTFIAILTSCSHAGLVVAGLSYFDAMAKKYGVEPTLDHYISVIDLLGRAGRLEEAYDLLRKMPFASNAMAWRTLLHSCLVHKDIAMGSIAVQKLRALQPDGGAGNYERLVQGCRGSTADETQAGSEKSADPPGCSWVT